MEGRASDGMELSNSPFASLISARCCLKMLCVEDECHCTKRDGSGIGLRLSRQIMLAHNGRLDLVRSDSQCTRFTLLFR